MENLNGKNPQINYWGDVSDNYRNEIISPFHDPETERIFYSAVESIKKKNQKDRVNRASNSKTAWVLDNGCGNGYFLNYLSLNQNGLPNRIKRVVGIDFSSAMIAKAKLICPVRDGLPLSFRGLRNNKSKSPVFTVTADSAQLPFRSNFFEEIVAVNSILAVERIDRFMMFSEIHRTLCGGGFLLGLFPSNENHLEQAYRIKENFTNGGHDENTALKHVYDELEKRRFDPVGGSIDMKNGDLRIKLYSQFELEDILSNHGFRIISLERFYYPEPVIKHFGLGASNNDIYDWLVLAEKLTVD
ncbi:class I SAM-dependent methyltransferase [candidate division KSB1 bacterium]|nr:class I SAM-dependent methyltransferase [candidate division KSB1 bacterium]